MEAEPVPDLAEFRQQLERSLDDAPNQWMFLRSGQQECPYYVTLIKHRAMDQFGPEGVLVEMTGLARGVQRKETILFVTSDLAATLAETLQVRGLAVETPALVEKHRASLDDWEEMRLQEGRQYLDGNGDKVVMDDLVGFGSGIEKFWDGGWKYFPVHPVVQVYHLLRNVHIETHVGDLSEYKYDRKITDKLVIEESWKGLLVSLLSGKARIGEDLIQGKHGGVVILCTGEPGTGKTLTAEIYAEAMGRPLYLGLSTNLGSTPADIETNLAIILERAHRWGAIVLIDEADTFIHQRGDNLLQNSVVGCFLRLLEYHHGVLFMTSNREGIIDDAIISRVTAHFRYAPPDSKKLRRIWEVLSANYGVRLDGAQIKRLVKEFPAITGRMVKQLLKLAGLIAAREGVGVNGEIIREAARLQNLRRKGPSKRPKKAGR